MCLLHTVIFSKYTFRKAHLSLFWKGGASITVSPHMRDLRRHVKTHIDQAATGRCSIPAREPCPVCAHNTHWRWCRGRAEAAACSSGQWFGWCCSCWLLSSAMLRFSPAYVTSTDRVAYEQRLSCPPVSSCAVVLLKVSTERDDYLPTGSPPPKKNTLVASPGPASLMNPHRITRAD